jgi:hypothetical protein
MGWASGTDIFDHTVGEVLKKVTDREARLDVIFALAAAMEAHDWDVQNESKYWEHPEVREVFRTLHPKWKLGRR